MIEGLQQVQTDITVFADDDVTWSSPELLRWVLAPFEKDCKMGGVATCQRLKHMNSSKIAQRLWRFLGALYIERRNFDCAATVYMDGGIPCISGRTAAYRTSILKDSDFIRDFSTESWAGNTLHSDDDNFLTRWVDSRGWNLYFQNHKDALVFTTLKDDSKFLTQCRRWARSNWRSNLRSMFVEGYIWRSVFTSYIVAIAEC